MNKRGRTKEDIFNVLKDRIVTLQYEPGKILNEIELSEEFGVSRKLYFNN
ncbi:GntR family transcriptional regulator [Parvimonas micra]|nr:GntR family transcriptional regulator [Parvimonas micra]WBB34399.1 GntR family transcriptional regulator [Parvimonas micra]WBB35920.1 GntR family transcriptional regulator [Parvimonas micra]